MNVVQKFLLLTIGSFILFFPISVTAQNVGINTTGSKADPSAMLDISSTEKGFLAPRMTSQQRLSINNPATGLLVYDITTNGFWYYDNNNGGWISLIPGVHDDAISDSDSDTGIQTEEGPDDDIIRFDIANEEELAMMSNASGIARVEFYSNDNIFLGDDAGENLGGGSYGNIGVGFEAGSSMTTGDGNVMIGHEAGRNVDDETANVIIGNEAGRNAEGGSNVILGDNSGRESTGNGSVVIGDYAGFESGTTRGILFGTQAGMEAGGTNPILLGHNAGYFSTGNDNIFMGASAGYGIGPIVSGIENIGIGRNTGADLSTGSYNVLLGHRALVEATTSYSTIIGHEAFNSAAVTAGSYNVAIGYRTGYNSDGGYYNTFIGDRAGFHSTSGDFNVFMGRFSGYDNTSGFRNSYSGAFSGYQNTTGFYNAFHGYYAGYIDNTGRYNSVLGSFAGANSSVATYQYSTAIGSYSRYTASNQVRVGRNTTTSIGGYQAWTNLSDGRFKRGIKEDVPGLEFIMDLRPVTYTVDMASLNNFLFASTGDSEVDAEIKKEIATMTAGSEAGEVIHSGFIAQEVEETAQRLGYEFSGVDAPKNDSDHYGLRYSTFVVPMVKAMQEQQVLIQELSKELERLKAQLNSDK